MRERFIVELANPGSDIWIIKDTEARTWNMPEKAVSLHLTRDRAIKIADLLNQEWRIFLANLS